MPLAEPPLPGNAHEVEVELARRILKLVCGLGIAATLMYVVVFAAHRLWWQALGNLALGTYMLIVLRQSTRRGHYALGLALLAWPVFAVLATASFWQNGIAGAAVWWLFALPLLLLQGGATRSAMLMAALVMLQVALLVVLSRHAFLPAPKALPLGDLQRAISMIGSLLFVMLLTMLSLRWRRELIARLEGAHATAAEAMQVKSRFLANMSHEIRTPLNGIVGAAELLRGTPLDRGQQQVLGVLGSSTAALMTLVNDVLDFSKLEAGRMKTERVAFDLHEAVHDAAEVFGPQAQAKGIELSASCTRDLPQHMLGDPARLRQILHNLVANAVKFTAEGEVHVVAAPDTGPGGETWLRISVRDTGIGMDDAQRRHLFEAFAQGDLSTTRRFGGSGLGLAISRELAALLGGHIEVTSVAGRGSTFMLLLPLQRAAGREIAVPELPGGKVLLASPTRSVRDDIEDLVARTGATCDTLDHLPSAAELERAREAGVQAVIGDERCLAQAAVAPGAWAAQLEHLGLRGVLLAGLAVRASALPPALRPLYKPAAPKAVFEALRWAVAPADAAADPVIALAAHPAMPGAAPSRPWRVLLAEDNPVNQVVAQGMLERLGLQVTIAADGVQALEQFVGALAGDGFDLVLMDCHMPELDGLACTRRLREIEAASSRRRTPVVALTASSESENADACRRAGMDDFIAKPVAFGQFERVLARWLK